LGTALAALLYTAAATSPAVSAPPPAAAGQPASNSADPDDLLVEAQKQLDAEKYQAALDKAKAALQLLSKGPEAAPAVLYSKANAYACLGLIYSKIGDVRTAVENLRAANEIYAKLDGAEKNHVLSLETLATLLSHPEQSTERAMALFTAGGLLLDTLHEPAQAARDYAQVAKIQSTDDESKKIQALATMNEALAEIKLGHMAVADSLARGTLGLFDKGSQRLLEARLGMALLEGGDADTALPYLNSAVDPSPPDSEGKTLFARGVALVKTGDDTTGFEQISRTIDLAPNPTGKARRLLSLGNLLSLNNKVAAGGKRLTEALNLVKNGPLGLKARIICAIGSNLALSSQPPPPAAEQRAREGLVLAAKAKNDEAAAEPECREVLADVLSAEGRAREAVVEYEALLRDGSVRRTGPETLVLNRTYAGALASARQYPQAADVLVKLARNAWDDKVAGLLGATRTFKQDAIISSMEDANRLISLALKHQEVPAILGFEATLLRKGLFSDLTRLEKVALREYLEPEQRQKLTKLRADMASLALIPVDSRDADATSKVAAELQEVETHLYRKIPASSLEKLSARPTVADVMAHIGDGEVLLEYVLTWPDREPTAPRRRTVKMGGDDRMKDAHYGVFAVTRASVQAFDLGLARDVDQVIRHFREVERRQTEVATFNLDERQYSAAAAAVWKPLVQRPLGSNTPARIIVAPVGDISLVPFGALAERESDSPQYLAERSEIRYLYTGRDLLTVSRKGGMVPPPPTLWMFGDPDFAGSPKNAASSAASGQTAAQKRQVSPAGRGASPTLGNDVTDDAGPLVPTTWRSIHEVAQPLDTMAADARSAGVDVRLLSAAKASETGLRGMEDPSVLVFATHGFYVEREPEVVLNVDSTRGGITNGELLEISDPAMKSMLILAGANSRGEKVAHPRPSLAADDGLMTAYEVADVPLAETQLVVMTSCESGLGAVRGYADGGLYEADGGVVAGLGQAFRVAGAKGVVMTMWRIPIDESMKLVSDFVSTWLKGSVGSASALHAAELRALASARHDRNSGHPFWWGGFIFKGETVAFDAPKRGYLRMNGTVKNGKFKGDLHFGSDSSE
jgi:CHAT domain-containing protein/tetratricopeptide (TPR) repeat protein